MQAGVNIVDPGVHRRRAHRPTGALKLKLTDAWPLLPVWSTGRERQFPIAIGTQASVAACIDPRTYRRLNGWARFGLPLGL